jgi:hypothetical protein
LCPRTITHRQKAQIRKIWASSRYQGRDFSLFKVQEVPSKYKLSQVLACGLKAACATYSQHWQGMYFDWTFNEECGKAISMFGVMQGEERFVRNAFATVVLINTGYGGGFMEMLRLRRRPIPPSMKSLEQIDMGTFEHNLKCAVGAVLGGHIGVNAIRQSLARDLANGPNREGCEALKRLVMIPGMNITGSIATVIQLGFKQLEARREFDPLMMQLAGAKLIERKSERRNADHSRQVPTSLMVRFFVSFRGALREFGVQEVVKAIVVEGNTPEGKDKLDRIRGRINQGLEATRGRILEMYEDNMREGLAGVRDFESYRGMTEFVVEIGQKVLKPREDGHKMVFIYVDIESLKQRGIPIDVAEQAVGEAIQAGLNSIHLEGTTNIPETDDLRFGAFCLTGPIHSAELMDRDEELLRGFGQGFWDILAPELPRTNKMEAIVAICAKHEQDAFIAERQAMEQRKSVNDIFWYRTWNHPEGKKLDIPQWISYAETLNVLDIPGNRVPMKEEPLPEHLPPEHPVTAELKRLGYLGGSSV